MTNIISTAQSDASDVPTQTDTAQSDASDVPTQTGAAPSDVPSQTGAVTFSFFKKSKHRINLHHKEDK